MPSLNLSYFVFKKKTNPNHNPNSNLMVHIYSPSTQEAEARGC